MKTKIQDEDRRTGRDGPLLYSPALYEAIPLRVELSKRFRFEAAHRLPNTPEGHKCRRLHGHSFEAEITVAGEVDEASGWLLDFAAIQAAIEPLRATLDHNYLNDIEGLGNPTSELIARWLWQRLVPALPALAAVEIAETCTSRCVYRGT